MPPLHPKNHPHSKRFPPEEFQNSQTVSDAQEPFVHWCSKFVPPTTVTCGSSHGWKWRTNHASPSPEQLSMTGLVRQTAEISVLKLRLLDNPRSTQLLDLIAGCHRIQDVVGHGTFKTSTLEIPRHGITISMSNELRRCNPVHRHIRPQDGLMTMSWQTGLNFISGFMSLWKKRSQIAKGRHLPGTVQRAARNVGALKSLPI